MRLIQRVDVPKGGDTAYEKSVITLAGGFHFTALILCIPIPIWNFIPAKEDFESPIRNANVEGWMWPCLTFYESLITGKKEVFFFWHRWKVRYKRVAPPIPKV